MYRSDLNTLQTAVWSIFEKDAKAYRTLRRNTHPHYIRQRNSINLAIFRGYYHLTVFNHHTSDGAHRTVNECAVARLDD